MHLRFRVRRAACLATAVLTAALTLIPAIPGAAETPTGPRRAKGGRWELPLTHIGYNDVKLKGQLASNEIFVPIPAGLRPEKLTGRLRISPDVGSGYLEFRQGDETLAVFVLDPDKHLRGQVVTIPLTEAIVSDDLLGLTLYARIRTADNACESAVIGTRVTLDRAVVTLGGTARIPASVGDFLPPVLGDLQVILPPKPTAAEAGVALRVASAAVDKYAGQRVRVEVKAGETPPRASDSPFSRTIMIRRAAAKGAALLPSGKGRILAFSGTPQELERASRAFTGGLAKLAVGAELQALELDDKVPFHGDRYTFEALGFRQLQTTGVGRLEIPLAFSQYGLGGSVRGMSIRLAGVHTPVAEKAHATLGLIVNDVLVEVIELDQTGTFDAALEVPAHLIKRDNTMTLRVDYAPDDGICILGIHPFTIQISPRSTVDVERGSTVNEGFLRYPQALRNGFVVAFDDMSPAMVRMALDLVVALQRLAGSALQPRVLEWADALADEQTAVLVARNPESVRDLDLPLDLSAFRVVDAAGQVVLQLESDARFAALQAYRRDGRDVLVLGQKGGEMDLMSRLATHVITDREGWFGLTGDLLVQPELGQPVNLNLRSRTLRAEPLGGVPSRTAGVLRAVSFPAAVIVAMILLAFIYPKLVRRAPADGPLDGPVSDDPRDGEEA